MIPQSAKRTAARTMLVATIASQPSPARFREQSLAVFASEPQKSREFRVAGMDPKVELEAHIALPLGAKRPEAEKEPIVITDLSGETITYRITVVTPLQGFDCYKFGLKSTREAGARPSTFR
jgi:hypothetical protein